MKLRDLRWEPDTIAMRGEEYSQPLMHEGKQRCEAVRRTHGPYAGTYYLRKSGASWGGRIGPQSMAALELACYLADCEEIYEAF